MLSLNLFYDTNEKYNNSINTIATIIDGFE